MIAWREDVLRGLAAARLLRRPLRQSRRRAFDQARRPSRSDDLAAAEARQARGEVHARGHGARRGRAARPSRDRASPRRGRVDGRDDRADGRDQPSRPRLSLVSIMGSTGARTSGQPSCGRRRCCWASRRRIASPSSSTWSRRSRSSARPGSSATRTSCGGSPRRPSTAGATRTPVPASSPPSSPRGIARPRCAGSRVPTLVLHGSADTLVRPSGGRATAKAIPGATLLEIPGMGHDLPRAAWPQIIDAIVANAARESAPEPAPLDRRDDPQATRDEPGLDAPVRRHGRHLQPVPVADRARPARAVRAGAGSDRGVARDQRRTRCTRRRASSSRTARKPRRRAPRSRPTRP